MPFFGPTVRNRGYTANCRTGQRAGQVACRSTRSIVPESSLPSTRERSNAANADSSRAGMAIQFISVALTDSRHAWRLSS